ncbi:EAL domain-containing protein [Pseudoalteromonas sp. S4491]|uniref:EAL domain-containing protein n=1 Tax=Pseudoalteromonas sp. S4491 TaxID=579559 RepID=UPI001108C89B|nr:EAL domain-containing protein [Pseudoalteromonas sp. S4491]TMO29475.1 hypothetical protein CWC27_20670 [Pseudoalteromonas sp. S4491]
MKTHLAVSFNITAQENLDPRLSDFIDLQLRLYPQPHNIIFQFYELDSIAYFSEVNTFINTLKNKGAEVNIKEFGAGFKKFRDNSNLEIE